MFFIGGGKLVSTAAIIGLAVAASSMQSASAAELEPNIDRVSEGEMSFVINTLAVEGQKGNDVFITNPSNIHKEAEGSRNTP